MSYRYANRGVDVNCDAKPDGVLDFSHFTEICDNLTAGGQPIDDDGDGLANDADPEYLLNEAHLNEFVGNCGALSVNWNGGTLNSDVAADIDNDADIPDGQHRCTANQFSASMMHGFHDWNFLSNGSWLSTQSR